ncbi:3-alpha-hydroxycholanate dehydrogenase (NADP(+)) [Paraburkholderia caffeinitolerans]|uniref:3-alpha-hydroxycholanate dehydrogenase (NADP(+)) n=1 Tax=Paraburkholderia caffeinitolerans TaxID=1723730 RepID=A0A6J5G5W9_9BURK|nr:SDR family oxidoreductase [Paraburkholderia caffeinitolerans]CAB3792676.1 3-alpha-hydroxycholanate dehydrogenase (NADP(+)) [Paraburkholderia caffeinitolerans]
MRTSPPLDNKVALVTGGSGGIGAACARALLEDGAAVVLMGRRRDALERVQQQLAGTVPDGRVVIYAGDACAPKDMQDAMTFAWSLQDRLDIVVPTVGGGGFRPILMHDADTVRAELDLNLTSAFLAIRYGAPLLAQSGGGSIVCISSTAARMNFRWLSLYCAAKAGLEALVKGAAEELGSAKVRVNAVRPGLTRSESTQAMFSTPSIVDGFIEQVPIGTLGEPEYIARAVRYLAGPESGWVTGQSFAVDGGHELRANPRLDDAIAHLYGVPALDAVKAGRAPDDV